MKLSWTHWIQELKGFPESSFPYNQTHSFTFSYLHHIIVYLCWKSPTQTHRFSCREEAWWTARIEVALLIKSWKKQRMNLNSYLLARHSSTLSKWFETLRENRMVYTDKNGRRKTKLTLVNTNQIKNFPGDSREDSLRLSSAMRKIRFFPLKKRK